MPTVIRTRRPPMPRPVARQPRRAPFAVRAVSRTFARASAWDRRLVGDAAPSSTMRG
jgi:hypothetical protein